MSRAARSFLLVMASLATFAVAQCGGAMESPSELFTKDAADHRGESGQDLGPYRDLTSSSNWTFFDTTTLTPDAGPLLEAASFAGPAFDGRYLYLPPGNLSFGGSVTARYDTQANLTDPRSWTLFDLTTLNTGAKGFVGAVFDGRYVYLVPFYNDACDGLVARYDTRATNFADAGSWSMFETTTLSPDALCFAGGTFDGRFLYLVPGNTSTTGSIVTRYDTRTSFSAADSWSTFDTRAWNPSAKGFFGAVFDGRYVYLVPSANGIAAQSVVARYDTQAAFGATAAWSAFDTTTVNAQAKGFVGAAFDGRYVYLVPQENAFVSGELPTTDGVIARFDTRGDFTVIGSWSTFDTSSVNPNAKGFETAAFDGRFLYLLPNNNERVNAVVARYDTLSGFDALTSWSTLDLASLYPTREGGGTGRGAAFYLGGAFDGRYIYFVPWGGGSVLARFEARDPPAMPSLPAWHGTFL